jgi:hypothetical protein
MADFQRRSKWELMAAVLCSALLPPPGTFGAADITVVGIYRLVARCLVEDDPEIGEGVKRECAESMKDGQIAEDRPGG